MLLGASVCGQRSIHNAAFSAGLTRRTCLHHPQVNSDAKYLEKGKARIQVDVVPLPNGTSAVGVNYFREGASFLASPVSPVGPLNMP